MLDLPGRPTGQRRISVGVCHFCERIPLLCLKGVVVMVIHFHVLKGGSGCSRADSGEKTDGNRSSGSGHGVLTELQGSIV